MSPTRLLTLLLPLLVLGLPAQAQKPAEAHADDADALDPNEWVIESYRFPDERLVRGFASEELGALVADINFRLDHHYGAPEIHAALVAGTKGHAVTASSVDFFNAEITSAITAGTGQTKLLGVWQPTGTGGQEAPDVLQLGFLNATIVEVVPLPREGFGEVLKQYGPAVLPIPEGAPAFAQKAEEIPNGMIVRRFRIPPDFLSNRFDSAGDAAVDPFAPSPVKAFCLVASTSPNKASGEDKRTTMSRTNREIIPQRHHN